MTEILEKNSTDETTKMEDREIKREQRLDQAAYILDDEIWPIKDKLDKACLILDEITVEYFEKYDRDKQEDHFGITWDFSRNATLVDIVFDYVIDALRELEVLEKRANKYQAKKGDTLTNCEDQLS